MPGRGGAAEVVHRTHLHVDVACRATHVKLLARDRHDGADVGRARRGIAVADLIPDVGAVVAGGLR